MTWNEMVTDVFMQGKKLPKEIIDTNNNQDSLKTTICELAVVLGKVEQLRNKLIETHTSYKNNKESMNIENLISLNVDMPEINKIVDTIFDTTLNGLTVKQENESKTEREERLQKHFSI